ncbi:EB module [Dictyocaulus viviparus]|uniref:EB module n=1 Tax=Dictyocaulus viviparus TaxID=29172 RepID=A0A0D8Y1G1_DICVI|nr:EB module [Dictyocaulus viviparus]
MLLYIIISTLFSITYLQSSHYTPCNGKSAIGGICDINADCEHKGSICLRNRCRCHPHYIETNDEKGRNTRCVPLPAKVGASCTNKCREPLFCRNGECQCVQRGTTRISNGECVTKRAKTIWQLFCYIYTYIYIYIAIHLFYIYGSRVGDRCSRHYDCTSPFSACLNSQCVCISGTIQQGSRCVAAANCPLGGLPGQRCVIKTEPALAFNLPSDQDDCPPGQSCVAAADSPIGHCCPIVCPLASHVDTRYSCDPNATQPLRCPSDTHFCHFLSENTSFNYKLSAICVFFDGLVSQAVCCRRPCNALAPNALYANNQCIPRGQLNSACSTNAQCGGGEGMECVKGQCQCLSGFHPSVDSLTHPAKNPSQTCSRDCESESLSKDTSCMKPGSLGSLCFVQRQCPQNSGCYRGRCMCRCGFEQKGDKCVALPPPPTTTSHSNIAIIPGVAVPRSNDLFKLFGQIFGGDGANNAIGSFING